MYVGVIVVLFIIGGVFNLFKFEIVYFISVDLFCCGLVIIIQSVGFWKFGICMFVMMGVIFVVVGLMVVMVNNLQLNILYIYGVVIVFGVFCIFVLFYMSKFMCYFLLVVIGIVIMVIGVLFMGVGINWVVGGQLVIGKLVDGVFVKVFNFDYGLLLLFLIVVVVLVLILFIIKYMWGFIFNILVLMGMVVGFVIVFVFGKISFDGLDVVDWFVFIQFFYYGLL